MDPVARRALLTSLEVWWQRQAPLYPPDDLFEGFTAVARCLLYNRHRPYGRATANKALWTLLSIVMNIELEDEPAQFATELVRRINHTAPRNVSDLDDMQ